MTGGQKLQSLMLEPTRASLIVMLLSLRHMRATLGLIVPQGSRLTSSARRHLCYNSLGEEHLPDSRKRVGDEIKVRVLSFGPLGASVVINENNLDGMSFENDLLPIEGLITQFEIGLFREARSMDIVVGDTLSAYVNNIREDGKIDVGLRPPLRNRISATKEKILEALKAAPDGVLPFGDKSDPELIRDWLPGVSKKQFKDAVGGLRREGIVNHYPQRIELVPEDVRLDIAAKPGSVSHLAQKADASEFRGEKVRKTSSSPRILKSPLAAGVNAVLITGLPYKSTKKDLIGFLEENSQTGLEAEVKAVSGMQQEDGRASGRAIISFYDGGDISAVTAAVQSACALNGAVFEGRNIRIRPFYPKRPSPGPFPTSGQREQSEKRNSGRNSRQHRTCVFFGNLPYGLTTESLVDEIESIVGPGSVVEVRPSSYGDYCHVDFRDPAMAAVAVQKLNQVNINGRPMRVDIAR